MKRWFSCNLLNLKTMATTITVLALPGLAWGQWTEQVSNSPRALFVVHAVSSEVAWAAGDGGQVVVTIDGGANWVSRPVPGGAGLRGLFAFDGQRCVVASDEGGFWHTTDGGAVWTPVHNAGTFINGIHFFNAQDGWTFGDPVGGEFVILETADGGLTWSASPNAPPALGAFGITGCFDWVGTDIGAFGAYRWLWRTTDGGAQWDSVRTNVVRIEGLGLSESGVGLVGSDAEGTPQGLLDRSTDFGQTWQLVEPPSPASSLRPIEWIRGTNEVWGATNQTGVFQSTNGGFDWVRYVLAPPVTFAANGLSFADINTGWCVGWNVSIKNESGRIFKYTGSSAGVAIHPSAPLPPTVWTYPNPFSSDVAFVVEGARVEPLEISIYDVRGRKLWTHFALMGGAGRDAYRWDGRLPGGQVVGNGMYFYRVRSATTETSGRLLKVR